MVIHRDDLDALARATELLLDDVEPGQLAVGFLAHVMETFRAQAALFSMERPPDPPLLAQVGLEEDTARELAAELGRALGAAREGCRRWVRSARLAARHGWRTVLASQTGREGHPQGVLALLSRGAAAFDPIHDCRLLQIMARQAGAAVERAVLRAEARQQAARLREQTAEIEKTRAALERRSRRLERTLAARSRFLASVTHDLRTPVNAVLGYSQLLAQGVYGPMNDAQASALHKLSASCAQLLSIVDDLLDLSKLDTGRIELRPDQVDLPALIRDAVGAVEIDAQGKGIDLRIELAASLPRLRTDPARVRQILLNLLSNAVKFTPRGSVTVTARHIVAENRTAGPLAPCCPPGEEGWVGIAVTDTGIGIPAAYLESIFDEFVQVAPPQGEGSAAGVGLGLAISSRLARLLGGELRVESEPGVRSTFELFLPCPAPAVEVATADA